MASATGEAAVASNTATPVTFCEPPACSSITLQALLAAIAVVLQPVYKHFARVDKKSDACEIF